MLIRIQNHSIKRSLFKCGNAARSVALHAPMFVRVVASTPKREVITRAPLAMAYDANGALCVVSGMKAVRKDFTSL